MEICPSLPPGAVIDGVHRHSWHEQSFYILMERHFYCVFLRVSVPMIKLSDQKHPGKERIISAYSTQVTLHH